MLIPEKDLPAYFKRWIGKRTQREVGLELGIDSNRVSDFLHGRRGMGKETLAKIGLTKKVFYETNQEKLK